MVRNLLFTFLLCLFIIPANVLAQDPHSLQIARVKYGGGGDWYSDDQALVELLRFTKENTLLDVAPREEVVELSSDKVFTFPLPLFDRTWKCAFH